MSRYRGPRVKITRLLGPLPGLTVKRSARRDPPGEHGSARSFALKRKPKKYTLRLQEKQKVRYNYGLTEKDLVKYVSRARRAKTPTGDTLLELLECRLDASMFRSGYAPSIRAARQMISHGHVQRSDKGSVHTVNIPSYEWKPTSTEQFLLKDVPVNLRRFSATDSRRRSRSRINPLLIVEYYSRT